MPKSLKCLKMPLIALLLYIFTCSVAFAARKQTYTYLLLSKQTVMQWRVDQSGKFIPLKHPTYAFKDIIASKLLAHPSGRFVYILGHNEILECKVKSDESLAHLGILQYPCGWTFDGIIDRNGESLYIAGGGFWPQPLRYRIRKDGSLVLKNKPRLESYRSASDLALHPSLPYLYNNIYYANDYSYGDVHLYKLNDKSGPSKGNSLFTTFNCGPMSFSDDGRFLYCVAHSSMVMTQYKVGANGKLKMKKEVDRWGYAAGPAEDDQGQLIGNSSVLITRSNKTIFVDDANWSGLHRFDLNKKGEIEYTDSYWMKDSKLISDKALYEQTKIELSKQNPPVTDIERIKDAYNKKVDPLGQPFIITKAPDSSLYAVGSECIAHFILTSNGSIKMKKPAYVFPKDWWIKRTKPNEIPVDICNLVFVQR